MSARFLLSGLVIAFAASACSGGGGGGGGDALVEVFPPSATIIPGSLESDRLDLTALVDGEPADVQWVVVGGGYVTVTNGPATTYVSPIEGIVSEPVEVSVFAFADGGEGSSAITLVDSAGILNVTFDNYDVGLFGAGALNVAIVEDASGSPVTYADSSFIGLEALAATYRADVSEFGSPQYVLWGDVGVEGEYTLAPDAPVVVPDDGEATLHVRWRDSGTGFLWAVSGTNDLVGFDGPSVAPGLPVTTRMVEAGSDRAYVDLVDTVDGLLWTADLAESSLVGFGATALGSGGAMSGAATVFNPVLVVGNTASIAQPIGIALDPATGDLWYANNGNGTFGRFDAAQIADNPGTQSTPAPEAFFLNIARTSVQAIAVDAAGNVWISDAGDGTVHRFDAGDVATSGAPVPAAIYSGGFDGIVALEFDSTGNLWLGDQSGFIYRLDAGQLAAVGPTVVVPDLTMSGSLLTGAASGLEFDDAGNLYYAVPTSGFIHRVDANDLTGTGTFTLDFSYVALDLDSVTGLAFRRHPPIP